MRGYYAFTKKELLEQLRTYKWLIILAVFFLFGMMSPVMAKILPEMLSGMELQGIVLIVPEATVMDAYAQFFKNLSQIGMFVVLLVFGGMVSNEVVKGTLINILAKGLPRHTVLLSKYTAAVLLWTIGFIVAGITTYGYTAYVFGSASVDNLMFSMFCLWLFGCFLLALIILSSTLVPGSFGGLILTAIILVAMMTINFPDVERYNPINLATKNMPLISGTQEVSGLLITVFITAALTVLCLALSIVIFRKKKL